MKVSPASSLPKGKGGFDITYFFLPPITRVFMLLPLLALRLPLVLGPEALTAKGITGFIIALR